MLTKLEIENFKSIYKESIDLGRVNVFIGENGCGKTNILEALGMASALQTNKLGNDELSLRGIRVTKPSITISSFLGKQSEKQIEVSVFFNDKNEPENFILIPENIDDIYSSWKKYDNKEIHLSTLETIKVFNKGKNEEELFKIADELRDFNKSEDDYQQLLRLSNYKIYSLSTQILRGIGGTSLEIPGIHGENLDHLINSFSKKEMEELEHYASMISWLDEIIIDREDALKLQGHKLNLSNSKLYFRDKFMQRKNNVFSAENANEGILHALFYFALFISEKTPKLFAIDNIETALNPGLCRELIATLVKLAKKYDKQVLITTHNPAILDGLNLHDDEQRLFTVARNKKGHTKVKHLKMKPNAKLNGRTLKLSEIWMRNYISALPQHL